MDFNQGFSEQSCKQYQHQGIDVMQVVSPFTSFESTYTNFGTLMPNTVLQAIMDERLVI